MEAEPRSALSIRLPAFAENVAVVRQAATGAGEALGLAEEPLENLKAVVSEAAMNAVMHAYGPAQEGGPLEVSIAGGEDRVTVRVRDYGTGFRPEPAAEGQSLRLGLPLIATMSDAFTIRCERGLGTEVSASFLLGHDRRELSPGRPPALDGRARVSVDGPGLLGPVLARLVAVYAARAGISMDRLSDTVLIGDAVSAAAEFPYDAIQVAIDGHDGAVEMSVGPLEKGGGERLLASMEVPGMGSIRRLADEMEVVEAGDGAGEMLVVRVVGEGD